MVINVIAQMQGRYRCFKQFPDGCDCIMYKNKIFKISLIFMMIFLLTISCSPFRPQVRKSPEGTLPKTFSLFTPQTQRPDRWWEEFNDRELNTLMGRALSGNFSLKEAWARLKQARALALKAGTPVILLACPQPEHFSHGQVVVAQCDEEALSEIDRVAASRTD